LRFVCAVLALLFFTVEVLLWVVDGVEVLLWIVDEVEPCGADWLEDWDEEGCEEDGTEDWAAAGASAETLLPKTATIKTNFFKSQPTDNRWFQLSSFFRNRQSSLV